MKIKPFTVKIIVFIFYAAISAILYRPLGSWFTHMVGGGDPLQFVWALSWWPHAIWHGQNPFVTDRIWSGFGFNLTWSTAIPTLAILSAPLTMVAGPVLVFNLVNVGGSALSAFSAYCLAKNITGRDAPSFMAGLVFGFSAYESAQMLGHLNLTFTPLIPLAVLLCRLRLQEKIRVRYFVIFMALTALAQMGISSEVLATSSVLGVVVWFVCLIGASRGERIRLVRLAVHILLSGLLTLVLAGPFLYYMVLGAHLTPRVMNDPETYSNDVLSFVLPTVVLRAGSRLFQDVTNNFTGNASEWNGYIGLPMLLVALWMVFQRARVSRLVCVIAVCTGVAAVFSMGGHLHSGRQTSSFALPWAFAERLPLLGSVLPSRIGMFVNLGMALLLAIFLSERRSGFRYAVAIIALLCLVPKRDFYRGGSWPTDPFFTPAHIKAILPPDPVVLILPFGSIGPCMALQVDAGFNFRQSGGYLGYTPAEASADPLISALQQRRVDADFTDQLARHVKKYKIDAILITPETDPNLRKAVESIGWQSTSDGDVIIVRPFEKQ